MRQTAERDAGKFWYPVLQMTTSLPAGVREPVDEVSDLGLHVPQGYYCMLLCSQEMVFHERLFHMRSLPIILRI
jgi:hypothetical protein